MLSATINRYAFASLRPRPDRQVTRPSRSTTGCRWSSAWTSRSSFDGDLDLVKAAVRRLIDRELDGFDLFLHSSAPPGSGLGASSAMIVALVGVLQERYRLALTDYEIAEIAHEVEREDLGIRGGLPGPLRGDLRRLQLHRVRGPTASSSTRCGSGPTSSTSSSTTCCWSTPDGPACPTTSSTTRSQRYDAGEADSVEGLRSRSSWPGR